LIGELTTHRRRGLPEKQQSLLTEARKKSSTSQSRNNLQSREQTGSKKLQDQFAAAPGQTFQALNQQLQGSSAERGALEKKSFGPPMETEMRKQLETIQWSSNSKLAQLGQEQSKPS